MTGRYPKGKGAFNQIFPELTDCQIDTALDCAWGASMEDIALKKNVSCSAVKKQLINIRESLNVSNISELRYLINCRILINLQRKCDI